MMDGRTAQFVHSYIAGRADGGLALGAAVSLFLQQPNWHRDQRFRQLAVLKLRDTNASNYDFSLVVLNTWSSLLRVALLPPILQHECPFFLRATPTRKSISRHPSPR